MVRESFFMAILALAVFCCEVTQAAQSPQIPLAGSAIPQFAQPLPILSASPFTNPPAPNAPYLKAINTLVGNQQLTLRMCEFDANVLPPGTLVAGQQPKTRVWGYIAGASCPAAGTTLDTYTGPVIVNQRGSSTEITFRNELGSTASTQVLAYKYSTDQTLHWADPLNSEANSCNKKSTFPDFGDPCAQNYDGPIPAVPHLHGGEVPPELDGGPDAWFTSGANPTVGHAYYSKDGIAPKNYAIYAYPNTQEASPIWFHDHTLGATRLNVYMGLAGGYIIEDPAIIPTGATGSWVSTPACSPASGNCLPANLPGSADIIPLVIQDRMFDTSGQLFFPADSAGNFLWNLNPEHPYWVPEFVGDTILVNGKAWPFLNVDAKRYRFLFLNGSNARTYELFLTNQATGVVGPPLWVIGTDGGYLDVPKKIDPALGQKLVIQPGERYEVIIDFGGFANTSLVIRNTGRTPFPKGAPPQGSTLGLIIQFRVGVKPAVDPSYNPTSAIALRSGTNVIQRLTTGGALPANVANTRSLTLNEVMGMAQTVIDPVTGLMTAYPGGPLEILVNNTRLEGNRINGVSNDGKFFTYESRSDFTGIAVSGNLSYYSELPREGDTEVWEIINLTADAHPIHLHLAQFQLISRQNFNLSNYNKVYSMAFPGGGFDPLAGAPYLPGFFIPGFGPPLNYNTGVMRGGKPLLGGNPDVTRYLLGPAQLPLPQEQGWKDTVISYPAQVTRIAVRWAPSDKSITAPANQLYFPFDPSGGFNATNNTGGHGYVWHCHIVDHEDNEMMRPHLVTLNPATGVPLPSARTLQKGAHY